MDLPIWMQYGCDAVAITKLVNQGMDLTQPMNETVLHHWAGAHYCSNIERDGWSSRQEDSLGVVKLLIAKGADLLALDNWGFTPLLEAANGTHRGELPNLKVLDFLLEREDYSRAEKIEAMELAGAVILLNKKNASLFHKGFEYWRKALHLRRQMEVDDSGFIKKPLLNLKNVQTTEWNTSAELEDVIEHPDKFVIQSFFVRLRIFSSKNFDNISYLFLIALDDCFRKLEDQRQFVDIFDIFWATLETLLSRPDLLENKETQWKTASVVGKLVKAFSCLTTDSPMCWTEEFITTSLHLIISAIEIDCKSIVNDLIQFVILISPLPQLLLSKDTMETLSKVRCQRGGNLLHKAMTFLSAITNPKGNGTLRLLLNAGCDPNAIDQDGNTPLHFLAKLDENHFFINDMNIIADLLVDFGAQPSLKNVDGKTAVELWIQKNGRRLYGDEDKFNRIVNWKVPDWCTGFPTLTCLSARVIRRNRIPYLELPVTLIPMIEKHKLT